MAIQQLNINRDKKEPQRMGQNFSQAIMAMQQHEADQQQRTASNRSIQDQYGFDPSGMTPKEREIALRLAGERENEMHKVNSLKGEQDQRYETVKQYFGPKAAELYKSAPEGGKTELLKGMIDAAQRGMNFEDVIGSQLNNKESISNQYEGLTPKETARRKDVEYKATRKEESDLSKPILTELNQSRKNIPLQEQAIEDIISASSEVSPTDYLADITGFEPLRSAQGAKLKTAIKDFFLSDLTRVGNRPNQWIEQQLSDALPKIGRSKEANHIVAEGLKFKVDLAKKRIDILDELAEKDRDKIGYVKGSTIDSRAAKKMKPYIESRQREMKANIEQIKKNKNLKGMPEETSYIDVLGPDGQLYEIKNSEIDLLPEGYRIK
jgi:hypothetical protein